MHCVGTGAMGENGAADDEIGAGNDAMVVVGARPTELPASVTWSGKAWDRNAATAVETAIELVVCRAGGVNPLAPRSTWLRQETVAEAAVAGGIGGL